VAVRMAVLYLLSGARGPAPAVGEGE